jgi:hypothetical protein
MATGNRWKPVRGQLVMWALAVVSVVIWVFGVYLAYYIVHKPFSASIARAVLDRSTDVAVWIGLLLLATALGQRLLRRLTHHSLLEELTLAAGLGLGLMSLLTFHCQAPSPRARAVFSIGF